MENQTKGIPLVTIKRTYNLPEITLGTIDIDGEPFAWTLELPYRNNERDISSIPVGEYNFERYKRPSGEWTFMVNVKFRDGILFHPANLIRDLKGCIGLGKEVGKLYGSLAIIHSKIAFNEFMEKMKGYDKGRLVIEV